MKVIRIFLLISAALLSFGACKPKPDANQSPDSGGSDSASAKEEKQVVLPDDPFFTEFAYPGTVPAEALTMGGATSVWYKSSDDFSKIAEFYSGKFAAGNSHVEADRGYFGLSDDPGGPCGATVNEQPDGTTQIILKREKKK